MKGSVNFLANIIWIIFGGLITAIAWSIVGLVLCITVVGLPLGIQAFKMAKLTFAPFGKEVVSNGKTGSFILNLIWVILGAWWMSLLYVIFGLINCITVIGIPCGLQSFKMAKLAFAPFGAKIQKKDQD